MNEEPQVLYCDAWLMAIDKPAGMIVHGDGTGERTLTDYASDLLLAMGDGFAATDMQPLNRLDRDTTGVVLFSLDKQTLSTYLPITIGSVLAILLGELLIAGRARRKTM